MEAAGADVSERAVAVGRERLGVPLHAGALRDLDLAAGSVDGVASLDTLYYVDDPVEELRAMRRLVRPGGYLVLRLRNGLWSRMRARRERSRPVGQPVMPAEHLWAFTPAATCRLLEIAGWRAERCDPAAYSRSALLPAHAAALALNRVGRRAWPSAPILTRSFTVVARSDG
jgi:SAM-dependent methyltransferase